MIKDCLVNYQFSTCKFQAENMGRTGHVVYLNCFECQNKNKKQLLYTACSHHVLNLQFSSLVLNSLLNELNDLSSYFGLSDSRMIASETDVPVLENERQQYLKNKRTQGENHFMK